MRVLRDGQDDGLDPLESLDVRAAGGFADMLQRMSKTAFGGRRLGEAYHVLKAMAADESCKIVVTVSGAMTVAKMGRVLCDMIDAGLAHALVTTGAIMSHGLSEAIGCVHYKHDPRHSDAQLYEWGYNRVYDTLEMEANLCRAQETMSEVLAGMDWSEPTCSSRLTREIGRRLVEQGQMPSILGCAFRKQVPVYIPAFTDSELGLDVATHFLTLVDAKKHEANPAEFFSGVPSFNPFLDLYDYAQQILSAERIGIVTIGGGVPRNWAQQVGPFIDIINMRLGTSFEVPRFRYGVRICPESVHWGGLSGCTYSEGVSWGKFVSTAEGGRFAEVHCDATIAWPLLIAAILEDRPVQQTP
ncbi:MAG: deoxyhypusine synthase family protein [Planctomycetaceae bacterium]|nr:deoxyhypusine synthase family protein [Planctomycetaceae bacterium]